MCKKANELIGKQQMPRQMSWHVSNKALLKDSRNVRNIYDKLHFDDVLLLEAMLTNRLRRKSTSKEKNSNKSLIHNIKWRNIEL